MIREIAVAAACAILVLEGMFTLQLYGLNAASGALAGGTVGGLGILLARFRCKASRHGRRRPDRRL